MQAMHEYKNYSGRELDFCPKCNKDTPHTMVADPIFTIGLKCLKCSMVWEVELKLEKQAF